MAMHVDPNDILVNSVQSFMRAARLLVAERWNGSVAASKAKLNILNNSVAKKIDCTEFVLTGQSYRGAFRIIDPRDAVNRYVFVIEIPSGGKFGPDGTMMIYEPTMLEEAKKKPPAKAKKTEPKKKAPAKAKKADPKKARQNPIAKAKAENKK